MKHAFITVARLLASPAALHAAEPKPAALHPVTNPNSPIMLAGDWVPEDTHRIAFKSLPRIPSQHAVVSNVLS